MRYRLIKLTILVFFFVLIVPSGNAQENTLIFGNNAVGFKYEYLLDHEREWVPFPFDSTEVTKTTVRPIRLAIWYPAKSIGNQQMRFNNYIYPEAPDSYFGKLNEVMKVYDMWSYGGMFNNNTDVINKLTEFKTNAYFNAPQADGKFPLIIYCSGWFSRSPDNAIMAEFLASHGYVVVTVPQLGTGSTIFDFEVTEERVLTQVEDLKFALNHISNYSNVNESKVASMGFSIGGIVSLWLSQIDDRVKTVIGLDASYMMNDWQSLATYSISKKRQNFPILTFYRGHEKQVTNITHDFINSLDWADRFLIKAPNTTHGDFYDEPYLVDKMGFPWSRTEFNTLRESLNNFYSVIQITKEFLDHILISEKPAEELFVKIRKSSNEKGLVFYNSK